MMTAYKRYISETTDKFNFESAEGSDLGKINFRTGDSFEGVCGGGVEIILLLNWHLKAPAFATR